MKKISGQRKPVLYQGIIMKELIVILLVCYIGFSEGQRRIAQRPREVGEREGNKDFWPGPNALPHRPMPFSPFMPFGPRSQNRFLENEERPLFQQGMGQPAPWMLPTPQRNDFLPSPNAVPPFMSMGTRGQNSIFPGNRLSPYLFATNMIDEEMLPMLYMASQNQI